MPAYEGNEEDDYSDGELEQYGMYPEPRTAQNPYFLRSSHTHRLVDIPAYEEEDDKDRYSCGQRDQDDYSPEPSTPENSFPGRPFRTQDQDDVQPERSTAQNSSFRRKRRVRKTYHDSDGTYCGPHSESKCEMDYGNGD
ncbi:uncharacterized protein LTR77_008453 [Saxophila tyrrhenica]|uniref:Uncharacterized protein n=1 Tax=Saxophila tyrrhenica TaxID=1690608 RepID=A0AAV9P0Y7_9PEZI|nr:hypothetical protein LTR77_008453 [Saxophila tyrrhenica]